MRNRLLRAAAVMAAAFVLAGTLAADVLAQRRDRDDDRRRNPDWVLLGEKEVGFRVDRDVIDIRQSEDWYRDRSFKALHLAAEGNDIHLISVRIVYFNGFSEDLRIDRRLRQRDEMAIDLRGERSYLRRIEMVYRARPDFRGRASLKVYGEPARRGRDDRGDRDWVELGCHDVALFGRDRDTIRVGRREGRFSAIRLLVGGADVEIVNLRVIYSNGQPDDIDVKHIVRAGERTRRLDLKGRERSIEQVELVYRTKFNPVDIIAKQRIRTARVCVEGLD